MIDKEFGNRLKWLRDRMGLEQLDLLRAMQKIDGPKLRAISSHESGKLPSHRNFKKYVEFYQCDEAWLKTGHGEPYPGEDREPKPVEYDKVRPTTKEVSMEKGFRERFEELVIENYQLKKRITELEETKKFAGMIANIMTNAKPPEGVVERRACATQIEKILNGMP